MAGVTIIVTLSLNSATVTVWVIKLHVYLLLFCLSSQHFNTSFVHSFVNASSLKLHMSQLRMQVLYNSTTQVARVRNRNQCYPLTWLYRTRVSDRTQLTHMLDAATSMRPPALRSCNCCAWKGSCFTLAVGHHMRVNPVWQSQTCFTPPYTLQTGSPGLSSP